MIITLSVFYYFYLAVVAMFVLYSLFNIYHLISFGFFSIVNVSVMIGYIFLVSIFLIFSFSQLLVIDWTQPILDFSAMGIDFGGFTNMKQGL